MVMNVDVFGRLAKIFSENIGKKSSIRKVKYVTIAKFYARIRNFRTFIRKISTISPL